MNESLSTGAQIPQLRLHHLFALTAVMAVMLGISGPQYDFGEQDSAVPDLLSLFLVAWGIVYSILTAIAITVVAYGIVWQRRGFRFFYQPGHWLLVEIAVAGVLGLLLDVIFRLLPYSATTNSIDPPGLAVFLIGTFSSGLFRLAVNIYIGLTKCSERRWKWVFFLKAIAVILQVVGDFFVLVMLSRASLVDRQSRVHRDLLHRCGVIIQIALSLLTVFLTVFFMLSFSLGLWR